MTEDMYNKGKRSSGVYLDEYLIRLCGHVCKKTSWPSGFSLYSDIYDKTTVGSHLAKKSSRKMQNIIL